MANITAADVNKLRQQTGAGMMDCKNALVESDGDFEKAIDNLRKKGQKVASNRADRSANEGIVIATTSADHTKSVVLMLNCETDFVAKNVDFANFAKDMLELAITKLPKNIEELKSLELKGKGINDHIMDLLGKIGEKIELSNYELIDAPVTFSYNHQGNRLATIVGFSKNDSPNIEQIGHEIAMQIAAMSPVAIDKEFVDQKTIDREIEIGKEQARLEGKPEEMLEKIAVGKLNKFFKESTLLNQEFVRDNKKTVGQYLAEEDKDLKVTAFRRLMLGA
jgi:elongation factor Ts